ncbi:hypothetical protein BELL_0125g00010 [Botrytis elliptica]|uniref:Uncharacterized protein n=1 Tax=Botrytis elliptica TaxID=278938 RepID=A0A4Z1JTC8_9HELO|nr:hypothetical protein BELL_0125g00010 [Botrytis elliptica]
MSGIVDEDLDWNAMLQYQNAPKNLPINVSVAKFQKEALCFYSYSTVAILDSKMTLTPKSDGRRRILMSQPSLAV